MKIEKVIPKVIAVIICAVFLATISSVSPSCTGTTAHDKQSETFGVVRWNIHVPSEQEYVPGEISVRFKPDVDEDAINAIDARYGTFVKETSRFVPEIKVLSISEDETVEEMVRIYESLPEVVWAEPNGIVYGFMAPNDPVYPYQWHLDNSTNEYHGINMESAWDISTGAGIVVAVLDTGVAYENYGSYCQAPDLAGTTFVQGYDFVNNDAHPNDDLGHGTHVTGTIAQTTNINDGFAGVAFDCSIMPVKIADATNFEPGVKNMQKHITYLGSSHILRVKLL